MEEIEKEKKEDWVKLWKRSEEELWKMLKGCSGMKKKMARERAKNIISKELKKRIGREVPKRIVV